MSKRPRDLKQRAAIAFDIDGVFKYGREWSKDGSRALQKVVDADMRYGVYVPSAKEMLTNFFVSLNPDIHASAQSLSQLPEQEFIFGKVASMLTAAGEYGDEVATNLAVVWQADETWTRSLLAGEVKPVEPEAQVD